MRSFTFSRSWWSSSSTWPERGRGRDGPRSARRPGQVGEPLDVGADQVAVRRVLLAAPDRRRSSRSAWSCDVVRQLGRVEPLAQLVHLAAGRRRPRRARSSMLAHPAPQQALAGAWGPSRPRRTRRAARAGSPRWSPRARGDRATGLRAGGPVFVGLGEQRHALLHREAARAFEATRSAIRSPGDGTWSDDEGLPLLGVVVAQVDHRGGPGRPRAGSAVSACVAESRRFLHDRGDPDPEREGAVVARDGCGSSRRVRDQRPSRAPACAWRRASTTRTTRAMHAIG